MKTRNLDVSIIDSYDNNLEPFYCNFSFNNVEDLDKEIDKYIIEDLNLSRVEVTIDDYNDELTEEEVEWLNKKGYYF